MYKLFIAETRKVWRGSLRYPVEFFGSLILLFLLLNGFIFGYGLIKVSSFSLPGGESFSLLIGFVCYIIAIVCLTQTTENVETEAKTGTLEKIFMSTYGPTRIFLVRSVVGLLQTAVTLSVLIGIEVWLFPVGSVILLSTVVPLILYAACWIGVGLFFGGLALRFKRVRVTLTPIYILLPIMLSVDVNAVAHDYPWIGYGVPVFPSLIIIRNLVSGVMPTTLVFLCAIGWALILIVGGVVFFGIQVRRVRATGSAHEY